MKRLNAGISDIRKIQSRQSAENVAKTGFNRTQNPLSCVDVRQAIDAKTTTFKPRNPSLTNFKSTRARDDSILRQSDRFHNLQLDHTKEQREFQVNAVKQARKQASTHGSKFLSSTSVKI